MVAGNVEVRANCGGPGLAIVFFMEEAIGFWQGILSLCRSIMSRFYSFCSIESGMFLYIEQCNRQQDRQLVKNIFFLENNFSESHHFSHDDVVGPSLVARWFI